LGAQRRWAGLGAAGALRTPGAAWSALAALAAVGALAGWWLPAAWLDWQPARAAAEPWRAVTAAFVHWSAQHLGANLLGVVLVAALGRVARLPWAAALAWLAAWPLVQLGLLLQPALAHYGGLSGVLHAGVAVAGTWLVVEGHARSRAIGAALLGGLAAKVLLERPWAGALAHPSGWDIALAPLAHASGAAAGVLAAALALALRRQSGARQRPDARPRHAPP